MWKIPVLFVWACVLLQSATEPRVFERDGNIHVAASGKTIQITALGLDSDPVLSPNGRIVAFVRRTPALIIDTGAGSADRNELWLTEWSTGAHARKILSGHSGTFKVGKSLVMAGFSHLSFSNNGSRVYFMAATWATAHALWSVDITTGKRKLIVAGAMEYALLRKGPHAGKLIVNRRSRCMDRLREMTVCYPYVLVTPDGKEGPRIGGEDSTLAPLVESYSR